MSMSYVDAFVPAIANSFVFVFGNRRGRNATDRPTKQPIEEQFLHSSKCGMSLFGHFCSLARYGDKGAGAGITMRKGARTAQRLWRPSNAINSCRFAPRPSVGYFDDAISLSLPLYSLPSFLLNLSSMQRHPRPILIPVRSPFPLLHAAEQHNAHTK